MQGQLTPEQQLKVLGRIWGYSRSGYVFLPWINGEAKDKQERRNSFHEGRAFKWPKEKVAILNHIKARENDELYFAVNIFEGKRRIDQYTAAETALYADLDPVNPEGLSERPTIAWESSPGRYQGIWLMNAAKVLASAPGNENHRLTAAIGADPSGWDSTQLLRVPGRPNFKPEYKDRNKGKPVMGQGLLWDNGPRYQWPDFDDLPPVGSLVGDTELSLDETILEGIDRHAVWAKVRLKVPSRIREFIGAKSTHGADRSDVLWDISCELAEAGCTAIEIVSILRPTVWNKFTSRSNELQLLLKGAVKAIQHRKETEDELEKDEEDEKKPGITWLSDVVSQRIKRPRWLIKDIWTKGGLGFISGAPKSYKSWMALDMAISISTGKPFLNQPQFSVDKPRPVLYLQEEDDIRLVMERLALITESKAPDQFWEGQIEHTGELTADDMLDPEGLMWAPPSSPIPLAMHVQTGFIATDEAWQAWLDDILLQGKFGMVIIDTLGTTVGEVDTDKSGELMTKMLKPLRVVARKHDTAICIVHHNKKAAHNQERAGLGMLGATALHAWVECAIYARSKDAFGEIAIEREAKLAMDMAFKVKIPTMFQNEQTGERQLWDPEIIVDGLSTVPDAPMEVDATLQRAEGGKAGSQLAFKLRQMGRGPFSLEEVMERLGSDNATSIRKQLQDGVRNGYLTDDENGNWVPIRK